ncbi:flagellar motor switch protein FliG [Lignipirellula cremea]|uniref:Flagellar motor switch protein FliG n=1 Tax=Lignipirellula cremea TaxID=2528010 RepID=A0A518E1A9_9BACT|nr:flagellar motor switch protein FliG [Lignipirellula cremea]QDU97853.1 Flagellar motor switch protein FliG [Lignipirellula cremea]
MNSIRKAAILLMSLPQDQAAMLINKIDRKQVELVSIEIAKLGRLSSEEQESAILDFAAANPNSLGGEVGGIDFARALLDKALGNDATATIDSVRQSVEAVPFGFLKNVDPQNLQTFINDEHPQTIALILSHLPPAYGAEIIGGLPSERQLQVIRRIATMGQCSPEVIHEVEAGLEFRMASVMNEQFENAGGVPNVAEILNVTDRTTERTLLDNLAQEDPDLVEEIRRLMFVFEDITKIPDKDIQAVLKNVESSQWSMALKNASEELKRKILGNMSSRAADMLREEMEYLGAVRLSEVENTQQQIVDIVRRLEDMGELTLHSGDEDDQYVS